jgi:GAF domain-containing protein/HAMP domain-containing protein
MVTTPDEQQVDKDLERRSRNMFYIALFVAIVSGLTSISTFLLQFSYGENPYIWITAVNFMGSIIAVVLARQKKPFVAAIVLISSSFFVTLYYIVLVDSIGTMLAIIVSIFSIGIAIQAAPADKQTRTIIAFVMVGAGLMILDQLWPGIRNPAPQYAEEVVVAVGVITVLAMVIVIVRQYRNYSIRGKLIGATLAVALLAVAVVAFGVNIFTTQAITNEVGNNLNTLTDSQALVIGEFLSRKVSTLEALSANEVIIQAVQEKNASYTNSDVPPSQQISIDTVRWAGSTVDDDTVKAVLESDAAEELTKFQQLFPDHTQILIIDKYGGQVGATQLIRKYYVGDEPWWQNNYVDGLGSVYIGEPIFDSESQTYSMAVAVPILGTAEEGSGEISGIIQSIISLRDLRDILINSRFGDTGTIELFLKGNRHLVVEEGEITINNTYLDQETVDYVKNPNQPFVVTELDGISHFLSSKHMNTLTNEPAIDELQWIILATQHSDEVLEAVEQQRRINTILGMIVVVSAGAVAAFVGQRISKPISNLTEVAQEVTSGNLDIQAAIETQDEIGALANSFNQMTTQLRESINTLEMRVQSRTQALATTVEVGRQLSTILDEDELVTAVVNQVRDAFNYYQTQIYLMAKDGKSLTMASATGQAGEIMLANKHALRVGAGLVGRAAELNQTVLVPNVSHDENWLPNPLLSDTKAETAVPIAIGDEVFGVLDVQHNIANGLQQEDVDLLQSVANQVAVALRNARLYKNTQQRAQNEALLRSITQKITSTTDMETAMKVAVRELGQATGSPETNVRLKIGRDDNEYEKS